MTDQRVDELLADLDRALAVEPSPSVAARVRTSIAREPAASWVAQRWGLMAASAIALVVVGTVAWPGISNLVVPVRTVATSTGAVPVAAPAATPTPRPSMSPQSEVPRADRKLTASAAPVRATSRDPEVLVSPNQRLALGQLETAIRDGRINSDSFPTNNAPAPLEMIVITPIVPEVVKLPLSGGGSGEFVF